MFFLINDAAKANVIFLVTIKSYLSSKAVLMEEFIPWKKCLSGPCLKPMECSILNDFLKTVKGELDYFDATKGDSDTLAGLILELKGIILIRVG